MTSYKIYLTKSFEVAGRIAKTFTVGAESGIKRVCHGKLSQDNRIPAVYNDKGYFYCVVELNEYGENDSPEYSLTIC